MSTEKRKVLGRGLEALIPKDKIQREERAGGLLQVEVGKLVPNEAQPRQSFDEGKLRELTESIRAKGVIHPLVVRKHGGGYQIVAGERRWRAAKLAGMMMVPVVVKELSDAEALEIALIENLQREDLNPIEEAEAYRELVEEHGLTQEQLAGRVGKQRSSVANMLRLLKLPEEIRHFLLTGEISMGHARAILGVASESAQLALAKRVLQNKLSVRQCEDLVRAQPARADRGRKRSRQHNYTPDEFRLVESLQRSLGTKVDLRRKAKGGSVIIHYFSPAELDRIVYKIEGR